MQTKDIYILKQLIDAEKYQKVIQKYIDMINVNKQKPRLKFLIIIFLTMSYYCSSQNVINYDLEFDLNNRLIKIKSSNSDTTSFSYDATGNRIYNKISAYCSRIVKSEFDNVYGSLRRTIECLLPNDTVLFEQTLDMSSLQVDGQINLEKNLYFKQLLSSQMTIQSTQGDTLFYITPQTDIYWENLNVFDNSATPTVVNDGKLTLDGSKITNAVGAELINRDSLVIRNEVEIKNE